LKSFNFDLQQAQILIKCSKGTYIRSIANDLGKVIGCGGHLIKLVRTQAGKFRIEAAKQLGSEVAKLEDRKVGGQEVKPINSSDVTEIQQKQQNDKNPSTLQPFNTSTDLISPLEVLDLPIVEVDDEDLKKVKNGISINLKDNSQFTVHCSQIVLLLYNKEKICAIGQIENGKIKLKKVFL
jgi:tRNA U55 pseudouridine synthase TruB